jgi:uroporphyrinogen decarboxylase
MSLFTDTLNFQNTKRPPVWFMRQAGRYMPSYKLLRTKHPLLELFHDEKKIVEITQQPIHELGVDAAILFSDILILLDGFEIAYDFHEGKGPVILEDKPLTSFKLDNLNFVFNAIKELVSILPVPLIGFAAAPFTLASYLIEKGSSRDYKKVKAFLYTDPKAFYQLLDTLAEAVILFLDAQADSGVKALQLFDSWAHILSYEDYLNYSVHFLDKIQKKRRRQDVPLIFFAKGAHLFLEEIAQTGVKGISIESAFSMQKARTLLPHTILQGNLDPALFYGSEEILKEKADHLLQSMKKDPGFIINLGHGIPPDAPFHRVKWLVEYLTSQS